MPNNRISKSDLLDSNIVDAFELASDGYSSSAIYLTTDGYSTTSGTKTVVITMPSDGEGIVHSFDHPAQSGDIVYLYGTLPGGAADGYYTINTIIDDLTFTTTESIATSTDGYVVFQYDSGSLNVGFSTVLYTPVHITHNNVQQALQDLDIAIAHANYQVKQVEINFGTVPTNYKTFIISDAGVNTNSLLCPTQAGNAPTGRSADENEMDPIIFSATPMNGQFTLIASTKDGPVVGNYKVNYGIG